jgi:hypothetical protein
LGLAIVRHLVELHGGTVRAHSEGEDKGATFTVKLPLLPVHVKRHSDGHPYPTLVECHSTTRQPSMGVRVLIVDDEADSREFLVAALEQCEAKVFALPLRARHWKLYHD